MWFFRVLAHSLTVAVRVYLWDKELDECEKLDRVKWLNEINHRVITKIHVRPYDKESIEGFFEMVSDYIEKNPTIYEQLEHCFNKSLHRIGGSWKLTRQLGVGRLKLGRRPFVANYSQA